MSVNVVQDNELKNVAGMDESKLSAVALTGKYSDLTETPDSLPADGGNADTVDSCRVEDNLTNSTSKIPKSSAVFAEFEKKANAYQNIKNMVEYAKKSEQIRQMARFRIVTARNTNQYILIPGNRKELNLEP